MVTRRTNRGVVIDLDSLISTASPNQPAVGNMKVNARGDVLGKEGQIVKKNEERVREHYKNSQKEQSSSVSLKGNNTAEPAKEKLAPDEPEEFDTPEGIEPLGFKEVEMPNGDIQMVPYYKEEDAE